MFQVISTRFGHNSNFVRTPHTLIAFRPFAPPHSYAKFVRPGHAQTCSLAHSHHSEFVNRRKLFRTRLYVYRSIVCVCVCESHMENNGITNINVRFMKRTKIDSLDFSEFRQPQQRQAQNFALDLFLSPSSQPHMRTVFIIV